MCHLIHLELVLLQKSRLVFAIVTWNHFYQANLNKKQMILLAKQGLSFWLQIGNKLNKCTKKKKKMHRNKKVQFQNVVCPDSHRGFLWGIACLWEPRRWYNCISLFGFCLPPHKVPGTSLTAREDKLQNISSDHFTSLASFSLEKNLIYCMGVLIKLSYLYECKWNLFELD